MDKQPVGQLPDLTQSNNDDEIMVITNSEYNQLKKEKISDFITDLQSTNTNNSLTTGSDGKLFVSKTINASDVDGVLSLDNIPQLTANKLPETGISADNYSYPSSITVNDRGQVVSIVEGSAAEAGAYLDQSQITNCILSAPNGVATFSGSTFTVKQGLKVLIPNGRNEDKTLKNIEYTVPEDKTINYTEIGDNTYDFTLLYGNTGVWALSQNYQEADTPPAFYGSAQYYLNKKENIMYFNNNNKWEPRTVAVLGKGKLENGVVTSFTPYQPVELLKRSDLQENFEIGDPIITLSNTLGENEIWLEGAEISRETYAKLFEIYGTTYGEGDGSTTFNLPDFRNRTIWGAEDFGYIEAGLPNITGSVKACTNHVPHIGALYPSPKAGAYIVGSNTQSGIYDGAINIDASLSSSIYGNSTTVQPPAVKLRIKTRFA